MTKPQTDDDAIRQRIRDARISREEEERGRVLRLIPKSTTPKKHEIDRLKRAERKMESPLLATRLRGVDDREGALKAYRTRLAIDDAQAHREEVLALAQDRECEVKVDGAKGVRGRVRLIGQDGLMSLYESEAISTRQKDAGLLFRAAFEGAMPPPAVSNLGEAGIGSGDADHAAAMRMKHRTRWAACIVMCKTVAERTALERIAGEGRTARSVAGGGNAHVMLVTGLRRVLTVIADRYI